MDFSRYTFKNIINMLFGQVPNEYDKKQGGLFYDILTPVANAFSLLVDIVKTAFNNAFIATANGSYLNRIVEGMGITRIEATKAIKRVYVYDKNDNLCDVEIGTLIMTNDDNQLTYSLIEKEATGQYKCECSVFGTIGNTYNGECQALTNNRNVGSVVMTDLIVPARDEETDTELRKRTLDSLNVRPFGGNIADYRSLVGTTLTEVGQMQVYPRDYNDPILNSIVLSVVDPDGHIMTQEQLTTIQETLDPSAYPGQGTGLVPIGHHPIVVSPIEVATNFSMTITPEAGRTVEELRSAIEEKISDYVDNLRDNWAELNADYGYTVQVLHSQVIGEVLKVDGVLNITNVVINDVSSAVGHYDFTETKTTQEIPVLGTITLS